MDTPKQCHHVRLAQADSTPLLDLVALGVVSVAALVAEEAASVVTSVEVIEVVTEAVSAAEVDSAEGVGLDIKTVVGLVEEAGSPTVLHPLTHHQDQAEAAEEASVEVVVGLAKPMEVHRKQMATVIGVVVAAVVAMVTGTATVAVEAGLIAATEVLPGATANLYDQEKGALIEVAHHETTIAIVTETEKGTGMAVAVAEETTTARESVTTTAMATTTLEANEGTKRFNSQHPISIVMVCWWVFLFSGSYFDFDALALLHQGNLSHMPLLHGSSGGPIGFRQLRTHTTLPSKWHDGALENTSDGLVGFGSRFLRFVASWQVWRHGGGNSRPRFLSCRILTLSIQLCLVSMYNSIATAEPKIGVGSLLR